MTRHPKKLQPGSSDSARHRRKIEAIEYTISTTMPGKIGLESLEQFGEHIVAAIEFLRGSSGQCKNLTNVNSFLKKAKNYLQLAIDAAHPEGNKKQRYHNITLFGEMLEEALKNW